MYFSLLPPEINSGNMYAGAGAGPLISAATAWEQLAGELSSAAAEYNSVLVALTEESWTGPSATAMTAAAEPYVAWMSATAAAAAQAATQVRAAAAAYEAAYAATVPPEFVAANRAQQAMLQATNLLGQNLAAMAENEAQYLQMWAQDAAAMQTYAASAAAATKMTAFTEPPQTTTGSAAATSTTDAGSAAAASGSSIMQFLVDLSLQYNDFVTNVLTQLTGSEAAADSFIAISAGIRTPLGLTAQFNATSLIANYPIQNFLKFAPPLARVLTDIPATGLGAGLHAGAASGLVSTVSTVSAGMSEANLVGNLSVPPSWASASPAIRMAAGMPTAGLAAAPATGLPGGLLSQAALGSMAGGAIGSANPRTVTSGRIRIQGGKAKTPVKLDAVIAKLQSQPEAVQHWNVDQAGLDELLDELSRKPGVHAVHLKGATKPAAPAS